MLSCSAVEAARAALKATKVRQLTGIGASSPDAKGTLYDASAMVEAR